MENSDNGGASTVPQVEIHLPVSVLRPYITFYYFVSAIGPLIDFLYPEWGNVRFELAGRWHVLMDGDGTNAIGDRLFGPTDRCGRVITEGGRIAGFGMTPLGWHRLIGSDANAMANRIVPLGNLFGSALEPVRIALASDACAVAGTAKFDELLCSHLASRPDEDWQVIAVDGALAARPNGVAALAAAAGMSARTLHRVCLRAFGFPPKRLLRRQRFLDTLGHVRSAVGDPLRTSLGPDYFDQAHFYRDFRDFMGMSPRAYFTSSRNLMARAAAAQVAASVTLSFKLPAAA